MARDPNDRVTISYRIPERLRARIEAAADADGLNLTQEITKCVEFSLNEEERSSYNSPLVRMLAMAVKQAELNSGKRWHDDEEAAQGLRTAIISIVDLLFPFKAASSKIARRGRVDHALDILDAAVLATNAVQNLNNDEAKRVWEKIKSFNERLNEGWDEEKRIHVLKDEPSE